MEERNPLKHFYWGVRLLARTVVVLVEEGRLDRDVATALLEEIGILIESSISTETGAASAARIDMARIGDNERTKFLVSRGDFAGKASEWGQLCYSKRKELTDFAWLAADRVLAENGGVLNCNKDKPLIARVVAGGILAVCTGDDNQFKEYLAKLGLFLKPLFAKLKLEKYIKLTRSVRTQILCFACAPYVQHVQQGVGAEESLCDAEEA